MTGLKHTLNEQLKAAMRDGNRERRDTLRMLLAAIKQVEVDQQCTLDDQAILAVLQKEAKKRQETIADYEAAGRSEGAAGERVELAIIEEYLPTQASEQEIADRAQALIDEMGVSGPRAIGQVMKTLMAELQGRADGKLVNQVVRRLLAE